MARNGERVGLRSLIEMRATVVSRLDDALKKVNRNDKRREEIDALIGAERKRVGLELADADLILGGSS